MSQHAHGAAHVAEVLRPRTRMLALIAAFKFVKAVLSILVALGAFGLLDRNVAAHAERGGGARASGYDQRRVERVISLIVALRPHRLEVIGAAALVYAALFATEGIGLWRGRRWAEWLTVVITASLVPFELYELVRRVTPIRAGALVANLAIVAYLVVMIRRGSPPDPAPLTSRATPRSAPRGSPANR
jgi:uncharacterized membrane protein (DUF2068 family)